MAGRPVGALRCFGACVPGADARGCTLSLLRGERKNHLAERDGYASSLTLATYELHAAYA